MTNKSLIFGIRGLVGKALAAEARRLGRVVAGTSRQPSAGLVAADFLQPRTLGPLLEAEAPSAVFLAVNYPGGVNRVETEVEAARVLHLLATQAIGAYCAERDIPLVFYSTDYVFDGQKPPYREEDTVHPLNRYGALKREAEVWIQSHCPRHLILRTTNVFGWDPQSPTPNFLMSLLPRLQAGTAVGVPSYLKGNPTLAEDLARGSWELLAREAWGLYHLVGSGHVDRFAWARSFARRFGLPGHLIEEQSVPPSGGVPRPLDSNLCIDRIRPLLSFEPAGVEEGLERLWQASRVRL